MVVVEQLGDIVDRWYVKLAPTWNRYLPESIYIRY